MEFSNVDAIMIGRASLGNPWIFRDIIGYLKNGEVPQKISKQERLDTILKHLNLEINERGEVSAIKEMRKNISAYTKSLPNSSEFRCEINKIEDKEQLMETVEDYFLGQV